jgi:hypothetical protein
VFCWFSSNHDSRQTNSGPDGAFGLSVPPTTPMLLVHKPGFAHCWKSWTSFHSEPEVLVLTPPFTVAGIVIAEAGQPVVDAEVWICSAVIQYKRPNFATDYAQLYGKPARDYFSTRSGSDGRFSIGQLPAAVGVGLVARKGDGVSQGIEGLYTLNPMPYFAGQPPGRSSPLHLDGSLR